MSSYRFYFHCLSAMKLIKKSELTAEGNCVWECTFRWIYSPCIYPYTRWECNFGGVYVPYVHMCMWGKSYRRRSMSLLLCSCAVFRTLIHYHYSLIIHKRPGLIFYFRFYHQGAPVWCAFGISISATILKCIHALGYFPRALFLSVLFLQLQLQAVYLWAVLAKSDGWFQIVVFWRGH